METNYFDSYDIKGYVNEWVTHKLFDVAFLGFKNALKRINKDKELIKIAKLKQEDCIEFISQHIAENIKWASNISFRDSTKAKTLNDVFVELDLFVTPLKLRLDTKQKPSTIHNSELFSDTEKNIILLGQPGAGKTTTVKKIFLDVIRKEKEVFNLFNFPLIIRLKEITVESDNVSLVLFKEIMNSLGVFYEFNKPIDEFSQEKILIHIFKDFIERLDVLIILDGYDEISNSKIRAEIIRNLLLISNSLNNSRFILTSRSADYDIHIDNSNEYEICPINENQIEEFINKWIGDEKRSYELLSQLRESPYWDTTIRPLNLAHLCALYERNNSIPEKPKSVYKKIIELLLEEWSNQRLITRNSKYAKFEVDRKMDFLSRLAYELSVQFNQISFGNDILNLIYRKICIDFDLPKSESINVIKEIESHNGLILQTGSDNFEFAHKSLLEYLVADYLSKLPIMSCDIEELLRLPNELAIQIAISSNASLTFFQIITNSLQENCVDIKFLKPFLSRLIIERPDFRTDPLLALTHIYLLNVIVQHIHNLERKISNKYGKYVDEFEDLKDKELKSQRIYYQECCDIIISFLDSDTFVSSLREVPKIYRISEVEIKLNSPRINFTKWGKTFLLRPMHETFKAQSINVKLPNNLILIGNFYKQIK